MIWQGLVAIWFTLPGMVVGIVILSFVRSRGPVKALLLGMLSVGILHVFVIPAIAQTWLGSVLLQGLFIFFEDAPTAAWVWCLYHVVCLQGHAKANQARRTNPLEECRGPADCVVIVGNGPSVMDGQPFGSVIDGFERVVRFNSFNVQEPAFTGSQVSYHFCNGRNFPTSRDVRFVVPLFNASLTHAVYLFMPHLEDSREIYANVTSAKVDAWVIEEERILALRAQIGCLPWQIPTSGAVAVDAFLRSRSEVSLHGFDFFQGDRIHYFEESPTQLITSWLERFVTHDPSLEKKWIEKLQAEGRAGFLARGFLRKGVFDDAARGYVLGEEDGEADGKLSEGVRKRPGLLQTIVRDGFPSQFSL